MSEKVEEEPAVTKSSTTKQVRTLQPTYRLDPKKRFSVVAVQKILDRIIPAELAEVEYSERMAPELCIQLAESIRLSVKEENFDRYRIIVCVSIGQRRQQAVQVHHSFLWDADRDGYAYCNYENPHIYANAVVYGIYLD